MSIPILPQLSDISSDPSSISNERRPSHIESYGVHCQEPTCNLGDFLPFKCEYCKLSYCSYHRLPFSHSCSEYDESQVDNRAKLCQFCEEPLRVENLNGRDTDINIVMEYHITNGECKVLNNVGLFHDSSRNGKPTKGSQSSTSTTTTNKKSGKICNFGKCRNIMWVEIKCPSCQEKFCPSHRERKSHKCGEEEPSTTKNNDTSSSSSSSKSNQQEIKKSPLFNSSAPSMKTNLSSSSTTTGGSSTTSRPTASPKSSPLSVQSPFSKLSLSTSKNAVIDKGSNNNKSGSNNTPNVIEVIKGKTSSNVNDMSSSRRAAREREQAAMALKNRAKKGLLTEDEKIRYATLQALEAQQGNNGGGKGKDCCVQ